MNAEIKMLKVLLGDREKRYTIRELAGKAKINYRIAYEKAALLEEEGLVKTTRAGTSKLCEFTGRFTKKVFEAEHERRSEMLKDKNLLVLAERLSGLKFPFIALLFGSRVKGKADRHSDTDILAIGGDEKEIRSVASLWPDEIHLTCVSYRDFLRMAKSKEFTVAGEAMKNSVVLVGIEEYYRLLNNAV